MVMLVIACRCVSPAQLYTIGLCASPHIMVYVHILFHRRKHENIKQSNNKDGHKHVLVWEARRGNQEHDIQSRLGHVHRNQMGLV